jgi:hypothetical protein
MISDGYEYATATGRSVRRHTESVRKHSFPWKDEIFFHMNLTYKYNILKKVRTAGDST